MIISRHFCRKILWMRLKFALFVMILITMSFIIQTLIKSSFLRLVWSLMFSAKIDRVIIDSNACCREKINIEKTSWFSMFFLRQLRLKHYWMRYLIVLLMKFVDFFSKYFWYLSLINLIKVVILLIFSLIFKYWILLFEFSSNHWDIMFMIFFIFFSSNLKCARIHLCFCNLKYSH